MFVTVIKPFKAPHKMVQTGEVFDANRPYALDLIRQGLVVEKKMRPVPSNKMAPTPRNQAAVKPQAAGADQPSSVSQVAQVSASQTQTPFEPGARRRVLRLPAKR